MNRTRILAVMIQICWHHSSC